MLVAVLCSSGKGKAETTARNSLAKRLGKKRERKPFSKGILFMRSVGDFIYRDDETVGCEHLNLTFCCHFGFVKGVSEANLP